MKVIRVLGEEIKVRHSHSFDTKALCPHRLYLHYVKRVSDRYVRVAAERGKAAHGAAYELTKLCLDNEIQPEDLDRETIRGAVQNHLPHSIMGEAGSVFEWLLLWAARHKISKHLYGYEEKIALDDEFDDCEWDDASYRGILDIMDVFGSHCTITDYKSQPHIIAQSDLDQAIGKDVSEQLTNYCWLASKMYPDLETFTARIWYFRYGFYSETSRTQEDLDIFENALMIKDQKISEIDNWDPIPGGHCGYCDFIHMCPLAQDLESAEVISLDQAEQTAARITVMESLTKGLKNKLKDYVGKNDAVRLGDEWAYGFNHKASPSWPAADVERVLGEHDRQLSEVANVDGRKMKKLLKEAAKNDPMLEGDLLDVRKEKNSTRFEGFKPE